MTPYFHSLDRRAALAAAASRWHGTPFVPHAAVEGAGVDCVWLAARLYQATGLLHNFRPRAYTMPHGQHNSLSQVIEWLDHSPHFARADAPLLVGDLVGFRVGRCVHHVGVVISERTFVHSCEKYGVIESRLDDRTWSSRLTVIYRPIES